MLTIIQGDSLEKLRKLPSDSVHCCVTSPPYWGLRDYGVPPSIWGGRKKCKHVWGDQMRKKLRSGVVDSSTLLGPQSGGRMEVRGMGQFCQECGAWLGALGLEPDVDMFISHLRLIFREIRRVLRKDGTCWVNMGDSYNAQNSGNPNGIGKRYGRTKAHAGVDRPCRAATGVKRNLSGGLKTKDLIGQPWRLAFALQSDGWYLRQDIIWHKPNPMPESIADRCTKSHEYIFLLSKSERYYYDQAAIRESVTGSARPRSAAASEFPSGSLREGEARRRGGVHKKVEKFPTGWAAEGDHSAIAHNRATNGIRPKQNASFSASVTQVVADRNKRSVWTVPTFSFPEAHFATYPPDLIKPCILAGCPVGGTVLDPFGGSGTTGQVALELGRSAILIELNPDYIPLIERRTSVTPGLPL